MKYLVLPALLACASLDPNAAPLQAATWWNQFRGPNGQGVADDTSPPTAFGPNQHVLWKTPIGPGHSSPVIWGQRIFLTAFREKELQVVCLDRANGAVLWSRTNAADALQKVHKVSNPAASTPVVDRDRVYVYAAAHGVVAYDQDGTQKWTRRFPIPKSRYGTATSPVLYGDLLLLLLDSDDSASHLLALKAATGETSWDTPRPRFTSSWTTPMIWTAGGHDEIVVLGAGKLAAYAPDTGRQLWWAGGFPPETISVPVAGDGLLFAGAATLGGRGDATYDVDKSWAAIVKDFDKNGDGLIQRSEMTKGFAIPLRLELPKDHPGYAFPNRDSDVLLRNFDRNGDQAISEKEWKDQLANFASIKPELIAIRAGAVDDARPSHMAWEGHQHIPEIPSPLYYRKRLYLVRDGGFLACVDGQYAASPVAAGGKVFVASADGVVTVLQAGDTLNILAQASMKEPIFATPALAEDKLYLRTASQLYAFGPK